MAHKKTRDRKSTHIEHLTQLLDSNAQAIKEGGKRKKWSLHDLKIIKPMTTPQEDMMKIFFSDVDAHICAYGSAGSGKTLCALYLALTEVLNPESDYDKIIIVRSAVTSRDLGYTPGDLDEKMSLFEVPYKDILGFLCGRASTYDDMKEAGIIKFMSSSYVRGLTWDNAIVIVDECQNYNWHEINSILTRTGEGTRLMMCGDITQNDLNKKKTDVSGMTKFLEVIKNVPDFHPVYFTSNDIVRSKFVKSWIKACEEYDKTN
jgi:predicted ribonuclease YlaK